MVLVEYSDSSSDDDASPTTRPQPAKKRKRSPTAAHALPPLPAAFLDQYSSTVRASTQDDPTLHAGRKRVTPHVDGQWPTHVYLEWYPLPNELRLLSELVTQSRESSRAIDGRSDRDGTVHSLLENDLGVPLPLHVSLSRPLSLRTEQRSAFLRRLKAAVGGSGVREFHVSPRDVAWHANETSTRWFLVLRLHQSPKRELQTLLECTNDVSRAFDQPLLYASTDQETELQNGQFHISLAWALSDPASSERSITNGLATGPVNCVSGIASPTTTELTGLKIRFSQVKLRIGQDVHTLSLG